VTGKDVAKLVRTQIGEEWDRTNLHGVDLRRSVVEPIELNFLDVHERPLTAWLVLRNDPDGGPGYGVAYEPNAGQFGLVQFAQGYEPLYIGSYGDFFDAFDAM
jgi:hypothetical protein